MKRNQWRGRGGVTTVHEVLDSSSGERLWGTQRSWRRLVGRSLGQASACLGVNPQGELRIMAGNEAVRDEILARQGHILAAWNTLARQFHTRPAEAVVSWVNAEVGRRSRQAGAARRRVEKGACQPVDSRQTRRAVAKLEPPGDHESRPTLQAGADPELERILARLAWKRARRG